MNGPVIKDRANIVVNGDVNGDGFADAEDSIAIWLVIMSGDTTVNAMTLAADVNKDGIVDQNDIDLVEQAGALNITIEQR